MPREIYYKVGIFWLVALANITFIYLFIFNDHLLLRDTDDAMRMLSVREFLAGKSWSDMLQLRLNPPDGIIMHWSRFADLPIAGLIWLFSLFLDPLLAEKMAVIIWPLFLMLPLLYMSSYFAYSFAGEIAVIITLLLLCCSISIVEYVPGRIDHHSLQITLALFLILSLIKFHGYILFRIFVGIILAISLSIGTEALPFIALAIAIITVDWICYNETKRWSLSTFAFSLIICILGVFLVNTPPDLYFRSYCDSLSIVYVVTIAIGAAFLIIIDFLTPYLHSIKLRFIAALSAGGGTVLAIYLLYPKCLAGPYSELSPELYNLWLYNVTEAQGLIRALFSPEFVYAGSFIIPGILGVIVSVYFINKYKNVRLRDVIILSSFIFYSLILCLIQIRMAKFTMVFILPFASAFIASIMDNNSYSKKVKFAKVVLLFILFCSTLHSYILVTSKTVWQITNGYETGNFSSIVKNKLTESENELCLKQEVLSVLNNIKIGNIMAPIDMGAHLLLHTKHSVVASPYHRNGDGIIAAIKFFNVSHSDAFKIANNYNIDYIVICDAKMHVFDFNVSNTIAMGKYPDWMEIIELKPLYYTRQSPIKIFRINK